MEEGCVICLLGVEPFWHRHSHGVARWGIVGRFHAVLHCWRLWHAPVITWDGLVVPCCFDKDAKHRMGDLKNKPFKEIWKEPEYIDFRRKILKGRGEIDICANCSEGVKVWGD